MLKICGYFKFDRRKKCQEEMEQDLKVKVLKLVED